MTDLLDDLARTVRALHDDAWRRHEDTKSELTRIAQAAALLGIELDMVRDSSPVRPLPSWADPAEFAPWRPEPSESESIRVVDADPPTVIPPAPEVSAVVLDFIKAGADGDEGDGEPERTVTIGDDDLIAAAALAGQVVTPAEVAAAVGHTPDVEPEPEPDASVFKCRWCDLTSTRAQAIGSHESSKHPKERQAARRLESNPDPLVTVADDLVNYRGPILACADDGCGWMVPVQKTGALDNLATHTLREHGRAPSRRERTPQARP